MSFACGDIGLYPGDLMTPGKAEDGVGGKEGSPTASLMEDRLEQQAELS